MPISRDAETVLITTLSCFGFWLGLKMLNQAWRAHVRSKREKAEQDRRIATARWMRFKTPATGSRDPMDYQ